MVKEPDEYTDVGAELRRLDQNIEGLIAKFQRQSQMIARTDNTKSTSSRSSPSSRTSANASTIWNSPRNLTAFYSILCSR
jgi:hypothetical protein